jgi:hypothetical protein
VNWKKTLGIGVAAVFITAVLGYAAIYAWFPSTFQTLFVQRDAAQDIVDRTYDADNAIQNYEWFKTQEQKIRMKQRQINDTRQQINRLYTTHGRNSSSWDYQTQQHYNRLTSTLLGQKQMYQKLVADYEARSSMQNREVFKNNLPYEFEDKFWTGDITP